MALIQYNVTKNNYSNNNGLHCENLLYGEVMSRKMKMCRRTIISKIKRTRGYDDIYIVTLSNV